MDDELITVAMPRKMWRAAAKALEIALASHEQSTAGATLTRAAHPTAAPAALRQQAEPGELPPLPDLPGCDTGPRSSADIKRLLAWGRLALAQSPLPAERVERVMAAAENCIYLQDQHRWGNASADDVRSALAAVRAILEGRQP